MMWAVLADLPAPALPVGHESIFLGDFGEQWITAICTAAGCGATKPRLDLGVDLEVTNPDGEIVRLQVKTTETEPVAVDAGDHFMKQLDVKTYDLLRGGNTFGFLAVVVVHRPHPKWTWHSAGRAAIVRATVYWARITGLAPTGNAAKVSVSVPLGNILEPATVLDLFADDEGGDQ